MSASRKPKSLRRPGLLDAMRSPEPARAGSMRPTEGWCHHHRTRPGCDGRVGEWLEAASQPPGQRRDRLGRARGTPRRRRGTPRAPDPLEIARLAVAGDRLAERADRPLWSPAPQMSRAYSSQVDAVLARISAGLPGPGSPIPGEVRAGRAPSGESAEALRVEAPGALAWLDGGRRAPGARRGCHPPSSDTLRPLGLGAELDPAAPRRSASGSTGRTRALTAPTPGSIRRPPPAG